MSEQYYYTESALPDGAQLVGTINGRLFFVARGDVEPRGVNIVDEEESSAWMYRVGESSVLGLVKGPTIEPAPVPFHLVVMPSGILGMREGQNIRDDSVAVQDEDGNFTVYSFVANYGYLGYLTLPGRGLAGQTYLRAIIKGPEEGSPLLYGPCWHTVRRSSRWVRGVDPSLAEDYVSSISNLAVGSLGRRGHLLQNTRFHKTVLTRDHVIDWLPRSNTYNVVTLA